MLKKDYRLPVKESFSQASAYHSPFFLIKIKKSDLPRPRFGFVVSKRVDKSAVIRNKIKRVLLAVVQENLLEDKGYDMLIVVKKSFLEENVSIKDEIKQSVEKFKQHEKSSY